MAFRGLHYKCRNTNYPAERTIARFKVPDSQVAWSVPYDAYAPVDYTAASVLSASWADKYSEYVYNFQYILKCTGHSISHFYTGIAFRLPLPSIPFNKLDGKVDRRSHEGSYAIDSEGRPLNPHGRTGIVGRGLLGRWGPNHAADPIVTRSFL